MNKHKVKLKQIHFLLIFVLMIGFNSNDLHSQNLKKLFNGFSSIERHFSNSIKLHESDNLVYAFLNIGENRYKFLISTTENSFISEDLFNGLSPKSIVTNEFYMSYRPGTYAIFPIIEVGSVKFENLIIRVSNDFTYHQKALPKDFDGVLGLDFFEKCVCLFTDGYIDIYSDVKFVNLPGESMVLHTNQYGVPSFKIDLQISDALVSNKFVFDYSQNSYMVINKDALTSFAKSTSDSSFVNQISNVLFEEYSYKKNINKIEVGDENIVGHKILKHIDIILNLSKQQYYIVDKT